jgi:proteic killer suppression protein
VPIKSFADTEAAFYGRPTKGFLRVPPNNRLEKLAKDRIGQHSVRINDQFRVCFRWGDGDAYDVEIVD